MPKIECRFFSEVLSKVVEMTVILPQETMVNLKESNRTPKYPTLFLLHGFSDSHSTWSSSTSLERYVEGIGLAVVMPGVDNSYYTDMVHGGNYWTYLTEELPVKARSMFPLSNKREENFVAGHSMGGFGALKWALNHPDQFQAVASMSGVTDMVFHMDNMRSEVSDKSKWLQLVFGEGDIRQSENDLLYKIQELGRNKSKLPMIYQACGTEDFLFEHNVRFLEKCKKEKVRIDHEFEPGDHNWDYWDSVIQKVLKWLPIENKK